jgi:hypothetical protein
MLPIQVDSSEDKCDFNSYRKNCHPRLVSTQIKERDRLLRLESLASYPEKRVTQIAAKKA